jgi:hypothetical protein
MFSRSCFPHAQGIPRVSCNLKSWNDITWYKDSIVAPQRTQHISIRLGDPLILQREMIALYCKKRMELIQMLFCEAACSRVNTLILHLPSRAL